ncbi:YisL family protein [Pontibacillus marinus]|uniref:UPF0344 protein N783_20440 n=1 Tax=Pontibacillus marinus BH030004 = DSM 16465 TaxID=1385511 RepID=A0A0A5FVJ4_9BACI|nr:YisL family protein [Pontibacillus marinus]KGX83934.1 hypothetical protein N783_20440 [Pontibacillus marinus BH030004 = DSM 16465]
MTHLHITSWVLALILLGVAVWLYRFGKAKPGKIVHMILRLDFLLILYSGGSLIGNYFEGISGFTGELIIKVIAGIWTIAAIEMIANKAKKRQPARTWWIQFFIAFIIAVVLGFGRLPLGIM